MAALAAEARFGKNIQDPLTSNYGCMYFFQSGWRSWWCTLVQLALDMIDRHPLAPMDIFEPSDSMIGIFN